MVAPGSEDRWAALRAAHRWDLPPRFNLAHDLCEKWAEREPDRVALIHAGADRQVYTFRDLSRLSARLSHVLAAHGIGRGDRVAVLLPQVPETLLVHLAAYRLGAIVVPLFTLFGSDGLLYRLSDSGARALVTDSLNLPKIDAVRDELPDLGVIFTTDGAQPGTLDLDAEMERARDTAPIVDTGPDDPAFICYTSGTTGPPKGALHAHRVLLGHLPAIRLVHNDFPQPGAVMWTPSDWAWLGGLCNIAMPSLHFGVPLLAHRADRFDPDAALALMASENVTNAFLAPTALKLMRQAENPGRHALALRSIASGGESLGAAMLDWAQSTFGLAVNEFYGQTECNAVLGNSAPIMEIRPGSMGKPVPGSDVAVLDGQGQSVPDGETGEIAIRRGDAAMFLEYWNKPEKTAERFVTGPDGAEWLRTGDEGLRDRDGYFHFSSRADDVITSSGYRVGPSEIEDCLARHPSVAMAACIGVPDPVRTEVVKAFVVLAPGENGDPDLKDRLRVHVRERLSPHVTPREIVWADSLPMTATGKILRRDLRAAEANPDPT